MIGAPRKNLNGHVVDPKRGGGIIATANLLSSAPVIPVNLDGVWGSIFSFDRGGFYGDAATCALSGDGELWQADAICINSH